MGVFKQGVICISRVQINTVWRQIQVNQGVGGIFCKGVGRLTIAGRAGGPGGGGGGVVSHGHRGVTKVG